ncbi:TonB-dependent receptor domain-containing protein, partial [Klebsiella pneumoniae]|uniref:TonB-dependent receptor domain-containing protein n=1 Tax=Klebsiella pneumoniae TaxID=573 RepID=UPI002240E117
AEYNHDAVPFRMIAAVLCGVGPIDAVNPVYGCGAPTTNFGFRSTAKLEGVAFYAQDQIALTDAWNVIAGVRHSRSDNDNTFATAAFSSTNSAKLRN